MVDKMSNNAWGSSLIKRGMSIVGVLIVLALCFVPAMTPAHAYTDGPMPNRYVLMPMTAVFYDASLNAVSFPLTSRYSTYSTNPNMFSISGDAELSVSLSNFFSDTVMSTRIEVDADPLLPSHAAFVLDSPVVLDNSSAVGNKPLFGVVSTDGTYSLNGTVSFRAQVMKITENTDGSLYQEFDWVVFTDSYKADLAEEEYWELNYGSFDVFDRDYVDDFEPTGLIVVDSVILNLVYFNSTYENFDLRVTQGSVADISALANYLVNDTTFEGWITLPEVDLPDVGGDLTDVNFTDWLTTAVGGFLDFELYPGISLSGLLAVVLGVGLTIVFLKVFAGG